MLRQVKVKFKLGKHIQRARIKSTKTDKVLGKDRAKFQKHRENMRSRLEH